MADNTNLDKNATRFEENEEMSMADLMKEFDSVGNITVGKELEVTIIAENEDGFMVDPGRIDEIEFVIDSVF